MVMVAEMRDVQLRTLLRATDSKFEVEVNDDVVCLHYTASYHLDVYVWLAATTKAQTTGEFYEVSYEGLADLPAKDGITRVKMGGREGIGKVTEYFPEIDGDTGVEFIGTIRTQDLKALSEKLLFVTEESSDHYRHVWAKFGDSLNVAATDCRMGVNAWNFWELSGGANNLSCTIPLELLQQIEKLCPLWWSENALCSIYRETFGVGKYLFNIAGAGAEVVLLLNPPKAEEPNWSMALPEPNTSAVQFEVETYEMQEMLKHLAPEVGHKLMVQGHRISVHDDAWENELGSIKVDNLVWQSLPARKVYLGMLPKYPLKIMESDNAPTTTFRWHVCPPDRVFPYYITPNRDPNRDCASKGAGYFVMPTKPGCGLF